MIRLHSLLPIPSHLISSSSLLRSSHLPFSESPSPSFNSKPTPSPQPRSNKIKRPNAADTSTRQTGQQTDALAHAQMGEERMRKHDGTRGEGGAAEIIGGEERSRVGRVGEGHVQKDALEDDEDADCEDADGEYGADPVDGGVGGPA